MKGILKKLDRAHSKINCRLAVIQVLLVIIMDNTVFSVLQSHALPNDILLHRVPACSCVSSLIVLL